MILIIFSATATTSLPSRERGLKSFLTGTLKNSATVAPFAGAWIEIEEMEKLLSGQNVAPFAGAWIEIKNVAVQNYGDVVAPFAGAWIEMHQISFRPLCKWSLPSRERGLKSTRDGEWICKFASLPSRERGLKCCTLPAFFHPRSCRSLRGSVD